MNEIIKQAPEIIPVLTDPANLWVNIGLAVVTFFAFLTALFQERIRKFWNKAILDMEINLKPPDCQQICMAASTYNDKVIYIRINVRHKSGAAGENVEIVPINFRSVDHCNNSLLVNDFIPISLLWSHVRTNTIRVPVSLFRHCDFGHFQQSQDDKAILILDTMVQPNPTANGKSPNVIPPGKYQFELLLSGDNVKTLRKKWELEFDKWSYDENEMLNNNIKIREIK